MKKIVIIISVIIIITFGLLLVVKNLESTVTECPDKVEMMQWNKGREYNGILETKLDGKVNYSDDGATGPLAYFNSPLTLEDMVSANSKIYAGKLAEGTDREKDIFLYDNSLYALEKSKDEKQENGDYVFYNLSASAEYKIDRVWFPMPVKLAFDADIYQLHLDHNDCLTKDLFAYSFEELCDFYGKLDDKTVSIDKENQIIRCDGCSQGDQKIIKDFLTIDYGKKTVMTYFNKKQAYVWETDKFYKKDI
ncbi:hypothetical protein [Eubacterium xylanophilum]|uniref:hypothetical protein n=1 Tax=Eubacterium xylanophilum TaxID=39497 RepID=UPI00047DB6A6|nr:hypothetical protein [Eubacterium xylanophilum]